MNLFLPHSVDIHGKEYEIRYDFRVILDILVMLGDQELDGQEKTEALLAMFYIEQPYDIEVAVDAALKFIDMNSTNKAKHHRVMDWEQDFDYIIAPVNHVLGYEARAVEYDIEHNKGGVHWWTFLSAYMEISSESTFAQIVQIRDKQARGKKLEKYEREWVRRNQSIVTLHQKLSKEEQDRLDEILR